MTTDRPHRGVLRRNGNALLRSPALVPFIALVLLLAYNVVFIPNFGRLELRDGRLFGSLVDILHNGAPVMLLAIGMTLVIATAGIDLSVGSVMALCGAVAALLMTSFGLPVPAAVGAALVVGAAAGAWNGVLVSWVGLQPIVATLILLVAGRGIAQWLTGDQKVRFENPTFEFLGNGDLLGVPVPVVIAAATALLVFLALRKTVLGMYIEAVGGNLRAARLCGIRVSAVRISAYAVSGVCAAMAGLIVTADIKEADVANAGLYLELDAILAVVIGGTRLTGGRPVLVGSIFGALIMQTLTVMLQMQGVVTEYTLMIKAAAALVVCALQGPRFAELWRRRFRSRIDPASEARLRVQ